MNNYSIEECTYGEMVGPRVGSSRVRFFVGNLGWGRFQEKWPVDNSVVLIVWTTSCPTCPFQNDVFQWQYYFAFKIKTRLNKRLEIWIVCNLKINYDHVRLFITCCLLVIVFDHVL